MKEGATPAGIIKAVISCCALAFSIISIMGLIANEQTQLSQDVHPALAYFVIWGAILWLTMVEGGQGSLVGLAPVDKELYKDSHPIAYQCTSVTNTGDNLDRYLLGRQLMVVIIVFLVNISGGPKDADLWGYPKVVQDIFFEYSLAMILFTCMVGQLNSQVNASLCMIDYINNYFAVFTLWVAMAIEFSGLIHASYLFNFLVAFMSGKEIESNEEERSLPMKVFFWIRCLGSLTILILCFYVTLAALFEGKTTVWGGIPEWVSVIVFFFLMSVVGMLEGMQIAFFACAKIQASERGDSYFAKKTANLLFKGDGNNLPAFMIGRQLSVVSCMFFIARVTTVDVEDGSGFLGASDGLIVLFKTGFLGALITTIVGSIAWQLVASAFPLAFMRSPFTYILLVICLAFEATGINSGAWVLAAIHKKFAGFQRDEIYIGTAEERAAKSKSEIEP